MRETIVIPARFNGPPTSGQGGYVAGLLANHIGGPAEVMLLAPSPLEKPLALAREGDGSTTLRDGELEIARAVPGELNLEVPPAPSEEQCRAAEERFAGAEGHAFATCVGCGPERAPGDGMRIFSGPVAGTDMVAAIWAPHASLAGPDGAIGAEVLWAALDCPGGWAIIDEVMRDFPGTPYIMLGTFTAETRPGLLPGTPCRVFAWPWGKERRKFFAGTAIVGPDATVWGRGLATWIAAKPVA